jgi:bacteriocin-like protein
MKKNNTGSKENTEKKTKRAASENEELTMEELQAVSGGTGMNIYAGKAAKKRVIEK